MNQENMTPYQDINTMLSQLSNEIRHIMPENLIGIYLTGSLSYGDFNSDSSDIDLIVIVKKSFTRSEINQIKGLHRKIETQYPKWAQRLECSYIPLEMLNDLASQDGDNALRRRIKYYMQPKLLAIDEVGYLSYSNRHVDLLFEIISPRHEGKPTLITTNKPFNEWGEIFLC